MFLVDTGVSLEIVEDPCDDPVCAKKDKECAYQLMLSVDPPNSGEVELAAISISEPFEGTYFVDIPVTLTANPAPNSEFVGWSDPTYGTDPTIVIEPGQDIDITALFEWSEPDIKEF